MNQWAQQFTKQSIQQSIQCFIHIHPTISNNHTFTGNRINGSSSSSRWQVSSFFQWQNTCINGSSSSSRRKASSFFWLTNNSDIATTVLRRLDQPLVAFVRSMVVWACESRIGQSVGGYVVVYPITVLVATPELVEGIVYDTSWVFLSLFSMVIQYIPSLCIPSHHQLTSVSMWTTT